MVFLSIDTTNYDIKNDNDKTNIDTLNKIIQNNPNNKAFILYYMEGCGPCNSTRPEWEKLKNVLKNYEDNDNIAIVDIDQVLSNKINNSKQEPNSFPTMRFITNKGKKVENYEDSNIKNKNRTVDSFVEWIKLKTKNNQSGGKKMTTRSKRNNKNKKWSQKYKRSINCNRPRGFSQKQYCKYSRRNSSK